MGVAVQRKMIDYVSDIFHHQLNSVKSIDLTEFEPINKVDMVRSNMTTQNKFPSINARKFILVGVAGIEPATKWLCVSLLFSQLLSDL